MAIMAIVFAAILPQFRAIQNSWDSKQNSAETLQNGRVLIDHLNRNLSKAVKITAVSDSSEINGYIEFQDNDVNNVRYDINNTSDYVEFGPIGSLSDLAGPVSQLQFTCYDGNDFDTPVTDVDSIRFVKVQTALTNTAAIGQNRIFTTTTYLRASPNSGSDSGLLAWWKLDETSGLIASDSSSFEHDGTLTNMSGNEWTTGRVGGGLEFDGNNDAITGLGTCPTGNFTVAGWAKDTGGSGWKVLYSAEQEIWFGVDSGASPRLWIDCGGNGNGANTAAGTWTLNTWHHAAATWDGTTVHIYIDGIDMGITIYGTPENPRAKPGVIGAWSRKVSDENWCGIIDDFRIYNRALSQQDVYELVGGAFQQDEGSNGIVSIEAEHYIANMAQGGHQWTFVTSPGGYSDEGAMEATPDSGTNQNTAYAVNSPHLDFLVDFVKTGTHYVWVRGYGKDSSADSCHAGLDGQEISTCDRMNYFSSLYAWHKETMDGSDATFNVSTAGIHNFNIWMCEDGFVIDKIVLTSNLSYTPVGAGPSESEQSEPGGSGGGLLP